MPNYDFFEVNRRAKLEPEEFVDQCEQDFTKRVCRAAEIIASRVDARPIVLLSGPSGSGKTTTAKLLQHYLSEMRVKTHVVSMDNYYRTVTPETTVCDENGTPDYESPECLDLTLLNRHFDALAAGQSIDVPKFDFPHQRRSPTPKMRLQLNERELVIFEGIHALNPIFHDAQAHHAQTLYVSARSNVMRDDKLYFKGTWMRLTRRLIRDAKFRGADAAFTMSLWEGVRRGEKKYISPYKDNADIKIDSSFAYEVCALKPFALSFFESVAPNIGRSAELSTVAPIFKQFCEIDDALLPHDSLLREFVGGGTIKY